MSQDKGVSPDGAGLSPPVEPASSLDGCATSIPDAEFHPSTFIQEEMDARDWDRERLAVHMGGDFARNLLMLDIYFAVGPTNTRCRLGERMAHQLSIAFDVSLELFVNLELAWLHDAQGIDAGTGETRSGSIREADESPVGNADAPKGSQ